MTVRDPVSVDDLPIFIHFFLSFVGLEDCDIENFDPKKTDPEYFTYECLNVEEIEKLLNESVEKLSTQLQITPSLAKVLLHEQKWNTNEIIDKYRDNANNILVSSIMIINSHLSPLCLSVLLCSVLFFLAG